MFRKNYEKKISNLMIIDNSGIDYSRMSLFVFCFIVYREIEPNSCAFSCLRQHLVYDLITKRSRQSCRVVPRQGLAKATYSKARARTQAWVYNAVWPINLLIFLNYLK